MAVRFTTTQLSGLRAAGRVGEMQHAVLAPILERELGSRYGRLLADFEPEGSDLRAWYAEAMVPPRRVSDLPRERQTALRETTAAMIGDIRALAERLASDSAKAHLARILVAATTYPEEDLWCDGDHPVLVNWGFAREERPEAAPRPITVLAAVPVRPQSAATKGVASAAGGGATVHPNVARFVRLDGFWLVPLLWLLFVLLIAGIDRLLLPACGLDNRWQPFAHWRGLDACLAHVATADATEEGLRLQALVRDAELQLARERQLCAFSGLPRRRAALGAGTY